MKKQIATITLNPAYDLIGACQKITLGDVNLVKTLNFQAAGKGINVAKILKQLGSDVIVGGFLGQDNPDSFEQLFVQFALENRFQLVPGRTRINVKLAEQNGIDTDFNFSGFDVSLTDWQRFSQESLMWLKSVDIVIVSGSLPGGIAYEAFSQWLVQVRQVCPRLIFDSSRETFRVGLEAAPWLVKPNRRELEIWAGRSLPSLQDVIDAGRKLQGLGIEHVIVSLGAEGAIWLHDQQIWQAKPPKCQIVSTVGAGDSMVGGLAYGLQQHQNYPEILRLATAVSALSVSQSGVSIADNDALITMQQRITLRDLV